MLREKPANEAAIARLIDFLSEVQFITTRHGYELDLKYLQDSNKVAKRTPSDLKVLGIIENKDTAYKWKGGTDLRKIALKILDHRLQKNKKTVHFPIYGLQGISQSLETITDRLAQLLVQNERLLKSPKIGQISEDVDLFKVDEQRLFLAGQIANGLYSGVNHQTRSDETLLKLNETIVWATDDLMKKLLNRTSGKSFEVELPNITIQQEQ